MKRSLDDPGSKKKKRRRDDYMPDISRGLFLLEVIDSGRDAFSGSNVFNIIKHKLRRQGEIVKYIVGQSGTEFQVRLTIFAKAWKMHRWDFFHATLYIDGRKVRSRFLEKPYNEGEEVIYVWDNNQEGNAFEFARRNTGRTNFSIDCDSECGEIAVELKAAEKIDSYRRERLRKHDRPPPIRKYFESAREVHMDDATKEKHTVLRTVEGRHIFEPGRSGSGRSPPAKVVSDYRYARLALFYDEAKHLEYRGILQPAYRREHRIYFPGRDFKKLKQSRRKRSATRPVIGDLTVDDVEVIWNRERVEPKTSDDDTSVQYTDTDWETVKDV